MAGSNSPDYLTVLNFGINLDQDSHLQEVSAGFLKNKFSQLQTQLAYLCVKVVGTEQFQFIITSSSLYYLGQSHSWFFVIPEYAGRGRTPSLLHVPC